MLQSGGLHCSDILGQYQSVGKHSNTAQFPCTCLGYKVQVAMAVKRSLQVSCFALQQEAQLGELSFERAKKQELFTSVFVQKEQNMVTRRLHLIPHPPPPPCLVPPSPAPSLPLCFHGSKSPVFNGRYPQVSCKRLQF